MCGLCFPARSNLKNSTWKIKGSGSRQQTGTLRWTGIRHITHRVRCWEFMDKAGSCSDLMRVMPSTAMEPSKTNQASLDLRTYPQALSDSLFRDIRPFQASQITTIVLLRSITIWGTMRLTASHQRGISFNSMRHCAYRRYLGTPNK